MSEKTVAVIGAGVMGCDIAIELASYDYNVLLKDICGSAIRNAEKVIRDNFKFYKLMKPRYSTQTIDNIISKISMVTDYNKFNNIKLVIENITEDFDRKEALYTELRQTCSDDAIYGVNTSCISITRIAALMPRPENVIGMHFMNPVPMTPLVEVVRGFYTSEKTIDSALDFLKSIEKENVVVNDYPGFVSNRVLMLTINECIWLVQDRVSEPEGIDKIFKLGFSHKMGPLATGDLIGLDTVLRSLNVLYDSYKDAKYKPCPLLTKMVYAGLLGRKTGKGFFVYKHK